MSDGNYLVSFGSGATLYTFPGTQTQLRDNFYDMVPRTVRLPGADGGFDQFGSQRAPKEIGNLSVSFDMTSESRETMDTLRDQVRAMANWGVQKIIKNFGVNGQRWCYGRVNSIQMVEQPNQQTALKQPVTIDFQVSDPYWHKDGTWGTGTSLPGNTLVMNNVTTLTQNINQPGTFPAFAKIVIQKVSGANITQLLIERLSGATVLDYIQFIPAVAITVPNTITVDATTYTVTGPLSNYYRYMSWGKASWFRMLPGANTIKVTATGNTGFLFVGIETYERY